MSIMRKLGLLLVLVASVAIGALPASTTFPGASGTSLPTADARWTISAGAFAVDGSGRVGPNGSNDSLAWWNADTFAADQYSEVVIGAFTGSGTYVGAAVRVSAGGNGYALYRSPDDSTVYLDKYVSGVGTTLLSLSGTWAVGDTIRLEVQGTTLTAKRNGTTINTTTDSSLATGQAGIFGYGPSYSQSNISSWAAGNLSGGSPATLSSPTPSGTIGTQTTATIGATTDQTSGTFYTVVDSGANLSGVTATQVKAGQKASGATALASGNSAVSTVAPSAGVTGLTANTAYAYASVQNNANGDSNVVTGTFTTAAAGASVILNPLTGRGGAAAHPITP